MKPKIIGLNLPHTDEVLSFLEGYGFNCERSGTPSEQNKWFDSSKELQKIKLINLLEDLVLDESTIVINGNGDYHHFTYGLCKKMDFISADYTVFLFDQHMDAVCINRGVLDCANYVPGIISNTNGNKLIAIGVEMMLEEYSFDSRILDDVQIYTTQKIESTLPLYTEPKNDVKALNIVAKNKFKDRKSSIINYNIHWKNIEEEGIESITDSALEHTKTEDVYITIDLDVLHGNDATTKYLCGSMHLDQLLYSIDHIVANKRLIGADITGFCGKYYNNECEECDGGSPKTLYSIAAIARAISGEPYDDILADKERNRR